MTFKKTALFTAAAGLALASTSVQAAPITILNAGFEDASVNAGNGNLGTLADWTEEDPGNVYVDNNGTAWVPEASRTLYFNGGTAAVNQDLGHNWSASDVYTLDLIAMNPAWSGGTTAIKVQLRQTDGTVLWDSGTADVTGTVVAGPAYSGTGHELSWNINANTFAGAGVVEGSQLNVRIALVSGFPYADNISLDVVPEPSSLALLGLGGLLIARRRRG